MKQDVVRIRVSDDEKKKMYDAADRAGVDFSLWARTALMKAARERFNPLK